MKIIFLFIFLVSCTVGKIAVSEELSGSTVAFDRVKISYTDENNSVSLKGKITVFKDSVVLFKFFGPIGVEVLSGKIDSVLVIKSKYADNIQNNLIDRIQKDFGVRINRKMMEYLVLFKYTEFFQELKNNVKSNLKVTMSVQNNSRHIISIIENDTNSSYVITFVKKNKFPLQILVDYKCPNKFFKFYIGVYSIHI